MAKRKNRKGRAMEGMIMEIKKEIIERGTRIESTEEGIIVGRMRQGKKKWRIMGVYVGENREKVLEKIKKWGENREEEVYTLIGDFNARTGKKGGMVKEDREEEKGEKRERQSKDKMVNREGRKLISCLEEMGWGIFNGCTRGNEQGEYTFTGRRENTVTDYIVREIKVWDKIEEMRVGDKVDSDHLRIEVWIERRRKERGKKREARRERNLGREGQRHV